MNDKRELTDFIDNLYQACLAKTKKQNRKKCDAFFELVRSDKEMHYPYIMSFSKNPDDVSQWERYADNSHGVCIEFSRDCLVKALYSLRIIGSKFIEVNYQYDAGYHSLCDRTLSLICNNEHPYAYKTEKGLVYRILNEAAAYKHSSFSSENEVRIILPNPMGKIEGITECFNDKGTVIKRIAKISLESVCKKAGITINDLITGVTIGPRSQQIISVLRDYIQSKSIEPITQTIKRSNCPLR